MNVYYINIVSECNLSVQVEYEVLRGPISAKMTENLTRIFIVLLMPGIP